MKPNNTNQPAPTECGHSYTFQYTGWVDGVEVPSFGYVIRGFDGSGPLLGQITVDDAAACIRMLQRGINSQTEQEYTLEPFPQPTGGSLLHGRNVGKRWEGADESVLVLLYLDGRPSSEIALILGRTTGAIIARLEGLGLFGLSTPRPYLPVVQHG